MNWLDDNTSRSGMSQTRVRSKRTNTQSNEKQEDVLLLRDRRNVQRQHLRRWQPSDQKVRAVVAEP